MDTSDWIPHRRAVDGELVGWARPDGGGFVVVDILGADVTGVVEWAEAEEALDALSLAWLADAWVLERGGERVRVRIVEVAPGTPPGSGRVRLKTEDYGAIDAPSERIDLPWPAPATLQPWR
ncbi:hypothetical protein [Microbacterium indicum]|uniref:hypothetical protein n=1 Tax=Microbacterium indicum TaxID=358100 RepID=UPI00048AE52B|nr:hypothetical protein [Microbacterium indicum]